MIPSVVKNPSLLKLSKNLSPVIQRKMHEVESEEDGDRNENAPN